MKFIKLTSYEYNKPMYINIETICAVYVHDDGGTIVRLSCSGAYCWIQEEPEKVLEIIENILHESNKK